MALASSPFQNSYKLVDKFSALEPDFPAKMLGIASFD
jgi:hypothetical protein